jgi:DNA replication protein DnaC
VTSNDPNDKPKPRTLEEILAARGVDLEKLHAESEPYTGYTMSPIEAAEWNRERAGKYFHAHTPAMFRHAYASNPAVLDWVERYLLDPAVAGSLALLGSTGTGKTYQAYGALAAIGNSGRPPIGWVARSVPDLFARLRPSSGIDTDAEYEKVANAELLLLDDLGAANQTDWTEEITFRLIDRRYANCLPTIVTTNLPLSKLRVMLGDRVSSRLRQMCAMVSIEGDDRRRAA